MQNESPPSEMTGGFFIGTNLLQENLHKCVKSGIPISHYFAPMFKTRIFTTVIFGLLPLWPAAQVATIMTWNLLNFGPTTQNKVPFYQTVLDSLQPDLLVLQEIEDANGANFFNSEVIAGSMVMAPFVNGPGLDNALFYNSERFAALANTPIATASRDISEFLLVHLPTGDTLRVFGVHLKSSSGAVNEATRLSQADSLRKVTDALPAGAYYLVCGDFNIYKSSEPAYQRLTETNNGSGYFIDPEPLNGTWNNAAYAPHHSQSTRTASFGSGATGGLDDRFDFFLFSPAFMTDEVIRYVDGSIWAVGNDGQHYNSALNVFPNVTVSETMAMALYQASDHLPVVAEIEFLNVSTTELSNQLPKANIFPNPNSGIFTVVLPGTEFHTLTLTDAAGRLIESRICVERCIHNTADLRPGLYFLHISRGDFVQVIKVMVK